MEYDLVIIGAGPGGYVAAIRAGQIGMKTAIIEKSMVGGMCLNWGCIPTKTYLESAKRLHLAKDAADFGIDGIDARGLSLNWQKVLKRSERIVKRLTRGVQYLLKKNGVEIITGTAAIDANKSIHVNNMVFPAKNIIIATGSRPGKPASAIPPGLIVEVEDLAKLDTLPENIVVWGSGPHAVELAQFFKLAGKHVTLAAEGDTLVPQADPFISDYIDRLLKKNGIEVLRSPTVTAYEAGELLFECLPGGSDDGKKKNPRRVPCQKVINASARKAILPESDLQLETEDGFLKVNDFLRTSIENIYAVGDVNGKSIFAHAASAQGLYVVNRLNGIPGDSLFDVNRFPINIYTSPEIAQVGLTEPQASALNNGYKISEFPLTANGKALIEGDTEGMVRIISDKKYGEVVGTQVIAPHATDMIAEAALLIQMEGTVYDVAHTVHAHPTVSEIFMEAGFDAFDQPIHQ